MADYLCIRQPASIDSMSIPTLFIPIRRVKRNATIVFKVWCTLAFNKVIIRRSYFGLFAKL